MQRASLVCLLAIGVREAKRSQLSLSTELEQGMTASEAVSKGLIVANDFIPEAATLNEPTGFAEILAQIQEHSNVTRGKTSKCPKMKGKNALCDGNAPCDVRNLVYITALSGKNLPSKMTDTIDPYIQFWAENKENMAVTPEYENNENPEFTWGCPFAYDGSLNFDAEVWDSQTLGDRLVGEVASSGGIKIDEQFLKEFDKDGDGRFELGLFIFKNGKKKQNKKTKEDSIVRFRFELLKAPGYELRRIEHGRSASRSHAQYVDYGHRQHHH